MTTVGPGVNIFVGVDLSKLDAGIKNAEQTLKSFQVGIKNLKLASLIQGDPFEKTLKYMDSARNKLNSVFDSWKHDITEVDSTMSKFAAQSGRSANKLAEDYKRLAQQLSVLKGLASKIPMLQQVSQYRLTTSSEQQELDRNFKPTDDMSVERKAIGKARQELSQFDLSGELTKLAQVDTKNKKFLTGLSEDLRNNVAMSSDIAAQKLAKLNTILTTFYDRVGPKSIVSYEALGEKLRLAFETQKQLEFKEELSQAGNQERILELRNTRLQEMAIKEAQARKEMQLGINVEKNAILIRQQYNKALQEGVSLTGIRQGKILPPTTIDKQSAFRVSTGEVKKRTEVATDEVVATEKYNAAIAEQEIRLDGLRKERELGINVEKNANLILKELEERMKMGAKLTQQEADEVRKLAMEYGKLSSLSFQDKLTYSTQDNKILQDRDKLLEDLTLKEARARKERELGINVEKNSAVIRDSLNAKMALGIQLSEQQKKESVSVGNKEWNERLKIAKDETLILGNRAKLYRESIVVEARARAERELGINVLKNNQIVMEQLNARKALGIQLDQRQQIELRKLTKEYAATQRGGVEKFLSPEWLVNRGRWFLQLRGAWALYRGFSDALQGAVQLSQELKNVQAVSQASDQDLVRLAKTAMELGSTTKFSSLEIAKGMGVFAQAGLTVNETLSVITDTAKLATATLFDFAKTSELVTSILKAWNLSATDTKKITDILATSINVSKLNMTGLATSLEYVTGVAPQLNVNLQETTALLATMVDRGVDASIAGTSLRAVMSELLKPTDAFRREVANLGLNLRDVDPQVYDFISILETLKKAGWGVENSFRAFDRRAAAGMTILVQTSDGLRKSADAMYEHNRASATAAIQTETLSTAWQQFTSDLVSGTYVLLRDVEPALIALVAGVRTLSSVLSAILSPIAQIIGGWGELIRWLDKGDNVIEKIGNDALVFKKLRDDIKTVEEGYYRLRDSFREYEQAILYSKTLKGKEAEAALKNAYNLAKQSEEITEEELELYKGQDEIIQKIIQGRHEEKIKGQLATIQKATIDATKAHDRLISMINSTYATVYDKSTEKMKELGQGYDTLSKSSRELETTVNALGIITEETNENLSISFKDMMDIAKLAGVINKDELKKIVSAYPGFQKRILDSWDTFTKEEKEQLQRNAPAIEELLLKEPKVTPGTTLRKGIQENLDKIRPPKKLKEGIELTQQERMERLKTEAEIAKEEIQSLKLASQREKKEEMTDENYRSELENIEAIYKKEKKLATLNLSIRQQDDAGKKDITELTRLNNWKYKNELKGLKESYDQQKRGVQVKWEGTKLQEIARKTEQDTLDIESQRIRMYVGDTTLEDRLNMELKTIDAQIAGKEEALKFISLDEKKTKEKEQLENDLQQLRNKRFVAEREIGREVKITNKNYEEENVSLDLRIKQLKAEQAVAPPTERLAIEQEMLDLRREMVYKVAVDEMKDDNERLNALKEMNNILLEQLGLTERIKRANDPVYDAYKNIKEQVLSTNQFLSKLISETSTQFAEGIAGVTFDITGGFQEQEQEIINLEGELQQLRVDYDAAIAEGDAIKVKNITNEMSRLNEEISDLKNPITQIGEMFRVFFKDLVDATRKAILQWLAMKAVMAGLSYFGGDTVSTGMTAEGINPYLQTVKGQGGILPHIESFKKFSRGGLTRGNTLALLGDNKSGRELVIPQENIREDSVSGYMRDSQTPIQVLNIVTPDDIAGAMTTSMGKRVIVNTIGRDMQNKGSTFRSYNV